MLYNNRNYPHPVLGISDDYSTGKISVELNVSTNKDFIEITPVFVVVNDEIKELIKENKAKYISHVYCRGTLYREVFAVEKPLSEPILIPSFKLSGEVEIDFFVTAFTDVQNFSSKGFNIDYGKEVFGIQKADVIAYAGKGKFYANKAPEELKSISALMNIDCSGESSKPMFLDYNGEKLTLMLSLEDYKLYRLIKDNKQHLGVLLCSLVLPALIEALNFLENEESSEFQDRTWFKVLSEIKDGSKKYSDSLRIAQMILDNPMNRCFESLTNDEAYD
jgi:hypothetical protein